MRIKRKIQERSKRIQLAKHSKNRKRTLKVLAIALYITFLLISTIPFMADRAIEPNMKDTYEYHLTYPEDGRQTHYYVERVNTNENGKIDLTYTTSTNSLQVKTKNIEVLYIYCRSMYEDECQKVFGIDPSVNSNYYKWYFIEKNHLSVSIESDYVMTELAFIDTPVPYKVYVNGQRWYEGKQYNYTNSYTTALSHVPKGNTHVDIYFKSDDKYRPNANFVADKTVVNINTLVYFDANASYDLDGEIIAYIWDFGDGIKSGGVLNAHSYSQPGTYGVILTVRDDDFLVDHEYLNITVMKGENKPIINGIVPNQLQEEDAPPWALNLSGYGIDLDSPPTDLRWFLSGENSNIYSVVGENSSDQKMIFSPRPNAYGNDLVKLWLIDNDGHTTNQLLWINITPINDKPKIEKLPDLVVHYDLPYQFSLANYISDVETPTEQLLVTAQDDYNNQYMTIYDQEIMVQYPKDFLNKIVLTTIYVSDGEESSSTIMSIKVTDNWPPILIKELPDIALVEHSKKDNVFDLDDYFLDPDGDDLYYTYSESQVGILIKSNNSVDIFSRGNWTGEEDVIFRARDIHGAIIEDTVKVVVLPINDPPVIGNIPDLLVHFNMDYYFDTSFYITDSDNELWELTLRTTDPAHIRISPNNNLGIILNYPKSLLGITSEVILTVSDGMLETNKMITVTVIPEYPPELIKKLPDVSFNEDEVLIDYFDLDDHFLDLDNDTLYYTTGNKMVEITIDPEHQVSFFSPQDWFGSEEVTFRATDPIGALVEDSIFVTVISINDPPILDPLPYITLNETETFEFDLQPFIIDVDTNASSLIIYVDNDNVFVSGTSLVLFGAKELSGEVHIVISDGYQKTSGTLYVKVNLKQKAEDNIVSEVIAFFIILIIIIIIIILFVIRAIFTRLQKFDIEEIFLIHNSGKLLTHVSNKSHSKFDDDIFSGMFTAIQGFIEESFSEEGPKPAFGSSGRKQKAKGRDQKDEDKPMKLNEFKVGENQVLIEHGQYIFMAVVYDGPGSQALHRVIKKRIKTIEKKYNSALEDWLGDMSQFKRINRYLIPLLSIKKPAEVTPIKTKSVHVKYRVKTPKKLNNYSRTKRLKTIKHTRNRQFQ